MKRTLTVLLVLLWAAPTHAFQILTPASRACHERITLGAFDLFEAPFSDPDDAPLSGLFSMLVSRAAAMGVPGDEATRSAIEQISQTYSFEGHDLPTRYVLASLMMGVRDPDTRGFSVVRVNVTRTTHLDDDLQVAHSLRRISDDGEAGNISAIGEARKHHLTIIRQIHTRWWLSNDQTHGTIWTFPLYGERTVRAFGPAFDLGRSVHALQDAFTHTLRDEDARIVSVLNFAEASTTGAVEHRDGLSHSNRLDTCEVYSDDFDLLRVSLARKATADLLRAAETIIANDSFDDAPMVATLDTSYDYRPGCTVANKYCDNTWVDEARTDLTEPIDVGFGCHTSPASASPSWPALVALIPLLAMRRRR